MRLACVACRQTTSAPAPPQSNAEAFSRRRPSTAPHSPPSAVENEKEQDSAPWGADAGCVDGATETDKQDAHEGGEAISFKHEEMTRCAKCDGYFHTPCLLKQQSPDGIAVPSKEVKWEHFVCRECTPREKSSRGNGASVSPLLVPAGALDYLSDVSSDEDDGNQYSPSGTGSQGERDAASITSGEIVVGNGSASEQDEEQNDWQIFSKTIEVCTACRQVDIEDGDKIRCNTCNVSMMHRRCCSQPQYAANSETVQPAASPNAVRIKKNPGRKRKRPLPPASLSCGTCLSARNTASATGTIDSRLIAMLARKDKPSSEVDGEDQVQWWRSCHECDQKFCLQEFCNKQPFEPDRDAILAMTSGSDASNTWRCLHCTKTAALGPDPRVVFATSSSEHVENNPVTHRQLVDQSEPSADASSDEIMATVLICDGCEEEFEMAALAPPLRQVPVGDWFCASCDAKARRVAVPAEKSSDGSLIPLAASTPEDLVTVLICDGCDGEFDLAHIVPPMDEVPEGEWFCSSCSVKAQSTGADAAKPEVGQQPLVNVTLLLCDGCDAEYEMGALNPPLSGIPEGDWFCPLCEPTRKAPGKSHSRKGKKGRRPKSVDAALPLPNGFDEIVTLLICDGCEGEFDASLLTPPLAAIPQGDWFCASCEAKKDGSDVTAKRKPGRSVRQQAAPLLLDRNQGTVAEVAACDGCGIDFDLVLPASRVNGDVRLDGIVLCDVCRSVQTGSKTRSTRGAKSETAGHQGAKTELQTAPVATIIENSDGDPAESTSEKTNKRQPGGKKRKRSSIGYQGKRKAKKAAHIEENIGVDLEPVVAQVAESVTDLSSVHLPQPVVPPSLAGNREGASEVNGNAGIASMLFLSDNEENDPEDGEDDAVVIVCDMCLTDFNMIEAIGDPTARAAPPRPWYCNNCVRSLKRTRKKKQRFSKQMLLEMQIYGGLLRPTAAKVIDLNAAALRGKPPSTSVELQNMFALVGKRVGIFLKWDKHWVMGRVLSFEATDPSFLHLVRFEDGTENFLPLYAFPMVVGTSTMLYVKVPILQNQWWPAQLLRLNPMAKKVLAPNPEDDEMLANFRLVSIYTSSDRKGKTQNVSCWVPKYLCRSMKQFAPSPAGNASKEPVFAQKVSEEFSASMERAVTEPRLEHSVLRAAFQKLLTTIYLEGAHRMLQFAEALVGRQLTDSACDQCPDRSGHRGGEHSDDNCTRTFTVASYNHDSKVLTLVRDQVKVNVDLARDPHRYFLQDSSDYAELAVRFYNSGIVDTENQQEKETREALDAAISSMPISRDDLEKSESSADNLAAKQICCSLCLLPNQESMGDATGKVNEELVECVNCSQCFHLACCDPPHDKTPLLSEEDGSVLIEDIQSPFVCSKCATCAGCSKRFDVHKNVIDAEPLEAKSPSWSQWRLPLQVVTLCADCVPFYESKQYCSVCLEVLSDDTLATCIELHSCSTCQLWVHAKCEPDPHPAFLACQNSAEYELDVHVELPDVAPPKGTDGAESKDVALDESESASDTPMKPIPTTAPADDDMIAGNMSNGIAGESKPARLVDEEFALGLKFKDTYDSKILNKYECLTCRKARMLQVVHRLKSEDKLELFKEPVTKSIAPTYFDVIKNPMDLSTMQQKILRNEYTRVNFRGIRDDFELMCLNAVTFNSKELNFLIWREAWRFYGQGQKIFRQTAPKSRMKHRGGKYYDALVIAAKRQLPNNSSIGKKRLNDDGTDDIDDDLPGSVNGDIEDDGDQDAEDERESGDAIDSMEEPHDSVKSEEVQRTSIANAESAIGSVEETPANSSSEKASLLPSVSAATTVANGNATLNSSAIVSAITERKKIPTEATLVLQSELGETSKPNSRVEVFKMLQARSSAHLYSWMDMCLVCGSAGLRSELIFCVDCGEAFHSFCVPGMSAERLNGNDHLQAFWRCQNCKMCEICGRPGGDGTDDDSLHFCGHCDRGYHGSCMLPAIATPGHDDDMVDDAKEKGKCAQIYCASCVSCEECGRHQPEMTYSYDQRMCLSCSQSKQFEATIVKEKSKALLQVWTADARKQKKDSEKCPLCKLRWNPDDEDLIQCDACELWAHPKCDSLLTEEPERYKKLVEDPSALYICGVCRSKERSTMSTIPSSWKCQLLVDKIQEKRSQLDVKWKEARSQLAQAKQWKFWKDHTPVYLYILRLGEECMKNLAYRSVNFHENWFRFTKEQELTDNGIVLPSWLVQKASRYLRFKRYSRGPKVSLRRQQRKSSSFYSQQGIERQKDASAISTIVSEACSCAALLACVHLFYGWRPLPRVVLHLLDNEANKDQGHEGLDEQLLKMLRLDNPGMTLDEEIVMIKKQYERRVGKRHLVREQQELDDSGDKIDGEDKSHRSPTASGDPVTMHSHSRETSPSQTLGKSSAAMSATPRALAFAAHGSESTAVVGKPVIKMTKACALWGWSTDYLPDAANQQATEQCTNGGGIGRAPFVDNRFCSLCFMIGDDSICGRLIYTDLDQWVHVNCALWSVEVFETADGVLQKCQKAKNRSRLIRCDACGVLGATVGCAVSRCQHHYHFPCAYDYGVVFLPNGETCCPKVEHIEIVARKHKQLVVADRTVTTMEDDTRVASGVESSIVREVPTPVEDATEHKEDENDGGATDEVSATSKSSAASEVLPNAWSSSGEKEQEATESADSVSSGVATAPETAETAERNAGGKLNAWDEEQDPEVRADTAGLVPRESPSSDAEPRCSSSAAAPVSEASAAIASSTPVLPVIDPSPEPRRHLRSDLPLVGSDPKKKGGSSAPKTKRQQCYRLGALTVHSLGHIVVGNPTFHSRDAIYPLGFRSTRIFWSSRSLQTRCLYECVVTNTDIEARLAQKTKRLLASSGPDSPVVQSADATTSSKATARAVFKIVASDDRAHPIVAFSADDALIELRSRVVALYDDQHCFGSSYDKNPFLNRCSWFSYGLSGGHFFGFSVPDIVKEIEQLPHAATTSISRSFVAKRLGQAGGGSRKRHFDDMMQDATSSSAKKKQLDVASDDDDVYVFTQHLPPAKNFEDALREIEHLVTAEERARLSSGSTRTDGYEGKLLPHDDAAPRTLRRRLNKHATTPEPLASSNGAGGSSSSTNNNNGTTTTTTTSSSSSGGNANTKASSGVAMDLEHLPIAMQYRELRRRPFDERLEVRKSKIHGYGLFTKEQMAEGQMIVEYQGQMIAQDVADEREKFYEEIGIGSCYMFRLDEKTIIDATRVGNLARFINHSCDPKAFARVVTVEGNEKKIVIFAKRAIDAGDEVTYDYKFPIEDEAIRCDCSAPNCIGRMN